MKTLKILMKLVASLLLLMGLTACSAHRFDIKDLDSFYATQAELAESEQELEELSKPKLNPRFYAAADKAVVKQLKDEKDHVVKKKKGLKKETTETIKLVVKKGTTIKDLLAQGVPRDIVSKHTHKITRGKFKGKDCLWVGEVITYSQTVAIN